MNAPTPVKAILGKLRPRPSQELEASGLAVFERSQRAVSMSMDTYRWVLGVVALVAVYFLLVASDRYQVEAQVYVKSAQATAPTIAVVPGLGAAPGGMQDALVLRDYIASLDMLRILDDKLDLRAHYSEGGDFYSAVSAGATEQEFLDHYRSRVSTQLDDAAQTLTLRVQAYSAEFARDLAKAILAESETFINGVGQAIARSDIAFVEGELERARAQLSDAQTALLTFQNENKLIDPEASGAAQQSVISNIQARIVDLETQAATLATFLNGDAAELVSVREQLRAMRAQLDKEQAKLTSAEQRTLNQIGVEFQQRKLAVDFAAELYRTAIESMEQARVEAYRKLKHLVVIQAPVLPEEAEYPRRLYNIFTVFVLLSLFYAIAIMVWATVQEHRDV